MARKVQVLLVDDLDGGAADETVSFALDGASYEIDLSSDNAKKQTYCEIGKLGNQIEEAEQKKDMNKIDELNKKVGELGSKLGPEYVALMGDLEEIDPGSKDGQDISAAFAELDKQCAK